MIQNKYYIINTQDINFMEIYSFCVGTELEQQRYSLDGNQVVLKLPLEADIPEILQGYTDYNHEEILEILTGIEWTNAEII